jgi:hypothetical protein
MSRKIVENRWNLWHYLYYRATLFYSKTETKFGFEDNKNRGSYTVGILLSLNIESLLMLFIISFFEKNIFLMNYMGYVIIGLFLFILFYSQYILEKKRHHQIFEKYKDETLKEKKRGTLILTLYILLTIASLFLVVYIGREYWK